MKNEKWTYVNAVVTRSEWFHTHRYIGHIEDLQDPELSCSYLSFSHIFFLVYISLCCVFLYISTV